MADDKKVMDVAKPGSAKPETGSKPMVIGHRSMATDPSVKTEDNISGNSEPEKKSAPAKKIRLKPISDSIDDTDSSKPEPDDSVNDLRTLETDSKDKDSSDKDSANTDVSQKNNESDESNDTVTKTDTQDEKEDTKEEKQEKIDSEQVEREERLQQLIKSKEYNVQIKKTHNFGFKTFSVTFLLVLVVGSIVIAGLIDAEILDLGIELPFDFL